ncbi:alginate lyase family protein, partial [Candidatus Pseudothioglobus singularis]|nr:alginate lyase family protein [Candidatus Pseudothioglobus singularis]
GTYFVFNCGDSAATSSEASSSKSNGLLPNTLKQIKVVKDWEPVADFEALKEYAKQVPIDGFRVRKNKEWNCLDRITNVNPYPDKNTHRAWFHCQAYVHGLAASNPQIIGDILLTWATASKDPMFVVPLEHPAHTTAAYDLPSTIGTFAQSYAFWYDEIEYTPKERKRVDSYMTKKLIEQKFPVMNYGKKPCDINNINSVLHKDTDQNNCGNIRMKVAVGEIMLGFRLENQTLLDKGHDDMYVVHAFTNEDGININHASRGGNTLNYSWEYTYYASLLAEIYDAVGYDYLEHTLPRGAKVHEYLSFNYRFLKDFKLTAQWAKYDIGSMWLPYSQIKNLSQEEYEKSENGQNVYRWEDGDKEFVKAHTKFVKRYMPELYTFDVKNYMGSNFNESPNFGVHPYMLHIGNNLIEENLNTSKIEAILQKELDKKQEENRLRLKKNAEAIKAKKAQEQEQLLAEIPIYDMNDEALILNLDQAEFFEISPPNQQNKNVGWETHKAEIYGELRLENFQIPKFRPLAFKFDVLNESRLSINVGELNAPEFRPFTRHQASLQKECGLGLMNEYDWMSFVSETTNMKSAKNQQCHYDYFKDANDEEAWKLFQAVLGGTDSILNYLEESVER